MASAVPNAAHGGILDGSIDFDTDDIRTALLMTNTTADTEIDGITSIASYTTLDEYDDTGYSRVALTTEAVNVDDANDRAEFDADDVSYTGLNGDATRDAQGVLIYKHVDGTDANDIPIAFIDFATDVAKTATQIDIPWDAQGILQLATAP